MGVEGVPHLPASEVRQLIGGDEATRRMHSVCCEEVEEECRLAPQLLDLAARDPALMLQRSIGDDRLGVYWSNAHFNVALPLQVIYTALVCCEERNKSFVLSLSTFTPVYFSSSDVKYICLAFAAMHAQHMEEKGMLRAQRPDGTPKSNREILSVVPPVLNLQALHRARLEAFGMLGALPDHVANRHSLQCVADSMLPPAGGAGEEEMDDEVIVMAICVFVVVNMYYA